MKTWDYYKTVTVPYPSKDEFTDVFVYSKGKVVWQGPFLEYKERALSFTGMLVEKTVNEAGLKAQRVAYGAEQSRLAQEFRADLLEDYGVTDHPKASLCFGIAYDYGHSSGFQEIASYFDTLVDLIKD
jgi:hypothetical protein